MRPCGRPLAASGVVALVRAAVPPPTPASPPRLHRPSTVAIGAFDGVHLGHRELISSCVRDAAARGVQSVVVTFDPDPSELLSGVRAERRLLSIDDRVALCRALGVDNVLVLPFVEGLALLGPEEFVRYLTGLLGPLVSVHVGSNFRFGHRGSGTVRTLVSLGAERGFSVVAHELLELDGAAVSSTRIRKLLAAGRVREAASLLGRHHFVRGTVAHGRGEGASLGFPTANLCCDGRSCMPAEGVYACVASDGRSAWPAAANVGRPPTFSSERDTAFLEANLLGFSGDLYGRELAVVFVEWLRASRPFSSLEELERVVRGNIDWVREHIGCERVEVGL